MAEYEFQTQPENEPNANAFVRPVEIPAQLGRENVSELVRNAMQLAETAIGGVADPEKLIIPPSAPEVLDADTGEVLTESELVQRLSHEIALHRAAMTGTPGDQSDE